MSSSPYAKPGWEPGTFFHLHEEDPVEEYENFKLGMWIFLATEVLLFGGIFVALFIFKHNYPEVFRLGSSSLDWKLGATNTVVLLFSSFTMALAVDAAQRLKKGASIGKLAGMLAATFCGGIGFMVIKYFEWTAKFAHGWVAGTDLFFSVYFMATGLHALHVLLGMSFIGLCLYRTLRYKRYHEENFGGVEVCGLYWHLVDLIWIYLFPLLYLLHW